MLLHNGLFFPQYLDKIGVAYFDQPASTSSSNGPQATNGFGGAGLMGLLGGGGAGGGLLGKTSKRLGLVYTQPLSNPIETSAR